MKQQKIKESVEKIRQSKDKLKLSKQFEGKCKSSEIVKSESESELIKEKQNDQNRMELEEENDKINFYKSIVEGKDYL